MALPDPRLHRVLALLSLPRTAVELGRELAADRFAPFEQTATPLELANEVGPILLQLEDRGYVSNLGHFDRPEVVAATIAGDDSLVDLHEDKAANYLERQRVAAYKLREGELWYWTVDGRDALLG